ncbi:unnamed protein product [Aphanomyces euteiches]|uniref:Uncharacterized protein n=1 Tax=Aphanomyces euteiches TaxID=100861 RepID=A0A6G0WPZ5_9STRA|nr:hypothetical protein Ae201684_012935 [Aphanomyces euteiches]KAH9097707.1 hypothetical protein Ae201684P_001183 [Aphanomyces euteiches]KAH9154017.1 hypothetical protein AeRB84_003816 [Aphanomyces euteiches]
MTPRNDLDSRDADLDVIMQKNARKLRMKQIAKKKPTQQPPGHGPILSPARDKRRDSIKIRDSFSKKQLFDDDEPVMNDSFDKCPVEEKRRSITIFDCAKLVDKKGRVMTQKEFEMASSPSSSCSTTCSSVSPSPESSLGKAAKKFSKKGMKTKPTTSEMLRQMAWEQMVLEIMCCLLPEIDVLSELNRNLVRSAPESMDLVGFQQQLHYHLNALHQQDADLPPPFTSGNKLVELYVNKTLIQSIVFGLMNVTEMRARASLGAISMAIFQHVPERRQDIIQAIECCAVEYFNIPETVHMKAFNVESMILLTGSIIRFQHELFMDMQQSMFDDMDDDCTRFLSPTDEDITVYDSALRILSLFCRSWSCGVSPTTAATAADAIFTASANLASNSTVKALFATIQLLAQVSPHHGLDFLSKSVLRRWPLRSTARQLLFLRLIPMLLVQLASAQVYMESLTKVVYDAFDRLQQCIRSPHVLVAREACALCDDLNLVRMFLLRDKALLDKLTTALHENAHRHWNKQIQTISDDHFDSMLDLA